MRVLQARRPSPSVSVHVHLFLRRAKEDVCCTHVLRVSFAQLIACSSCFSNGVYTRCLCTQDDDDDKDYDDGKDKGKDKISRGKIRSAKRKASGMCHFTNVLVLMYLGIFLHR